MKHSGNAERTGMMTLAAVIFNAVVLRNGLILNPKWYWVLCFSVPILILLILRSRAIRKQ
jgi:hypothetical protein